LSETKPSTRDLYNASASHWSREQALLLSDFTARPRVLDVVAPVHGLEVWDLGCGEGYMARALLRAGARLVRGFDISEQLVTQAQMASPSAGAAVYERRDLGDPGQWPEGCCDAALAVFLFNYLSLAQMEGVLRGMRKALRPGGRFVFTVPHPLFPFLCRQEAPFFFDPAGQAYTNSTDALFEGWIWRRDGERVAVHCRHKTVADYFAALERSGWLGLPRVEELGVSDALLQEDPAFFGPLARLPLHLLIALTA
jgi:SAM-dependent methyltransferase